MEGANNFSFAGNAVIRYRRFIALFGRDEFDNASVINGLGAHTVTLFAWLFPVLLIFLVIRLFTEKDSRFKQHSSLLLLLFIVSYAGLHLTVTGFRAQHLFFLVPLVQIIMAVSLAGMFRFASSRKTPGIPLLLFAAAAAVTASLFVAQNTLLIRRFSSEPNISRKIENSRESETAVDFLLTRGMHKVYILNDQWIISFKLRFLSQNRVIYFLRC